MSVTLNVYLHFEGVLHVFRPFIKHHDKVAERYTEYFRNELGNSFVFDFESFSAFEPEGLNPLLPIGAVTVANDTEAVFLKLRHGEKYRFEVAE